MRFSLILATVGRTDDLHRFLQSLAEQDFQDFELIVVDQNTDDRLLFILDPFRQRFPIIHLRSEQGLSRARNKGLARVRGEILSFPDDDCWYPPSLLKSVDDFFAQNPELDGLTGKVVDEKGKPTVTFWDSHPGFINIFNVWRRSSSISIFVRLAMVDKIGVFDESLGLGAGTPWGSGEDIELLIRAVESGYRIYYDSLLNVGHPEPPNRISNLEIQKAHYYALGMGRVLRIHHYPLWFVVYMLFRSFAAMLLALLRGQVMDAAFQLHVFRGRIGGWLG